MSVAKISRDLKDPVRSQDASAVIQWWSQNITVKALQVPFMEAVARLLEDERERAAMTGRLGGAKLVVEVMTLYLVPTTIHSPCLPVACLPYSAFPCMPVHFLVLTV